MSMIYLRYIVTFGYIKFKPSEMYWVKYLVFEYRIGTDAGTALLSKFHCYIVYNYVNGWLAPKKFRCNNILVWDKCDLLGEIVAHKGQENRHSR